MQTKDTAKRYIMLTLGLIINAFGGAMVIKAGMGSSPLAVVPYTFSLISQSISYGTMVIIYNNLMNVLQIIILKGKVKKSEVAVQILSSFCFGYCLDLSMMLLSRLAPSLYVMKLLTLLIACVIIAFGSYLELIANVAMLPAEAFIRAIAEVTKKEFGSVRVAFEISQTVFAALLGIAVLGKLGGVREGTLFTALLVGNIVRIMCRWFMPLTKALFPEKSQTSLTE